MDREADTPAKPVICDKPIEELLATPVGFVSCVLEMPLYQWQADILTWYEDTTKRTKGAAVTPNGAGKSSAVVAGLVLWWLAVHPKGKVVVTSKDGRQLKAQTWNAIMGQSERFPTWNFGDNRIQTPTGGFAIGFTTDEAGRAEGWHKINDIEGPLLIIVDEAKSVADDIFQAFDRCTFNAILYISSPGAKMGRFYEAFTKDAERFHRRQVSLTECPHIPKEKIDDIISTYGAEHPFTLSAVYGRFMASEDLEEYVFNVDAIERCKLNAPRHEPGERVAFCDFGKGKAEHTIAVRDGNKLTHLIAWREADEMAAVGRFIMHFRKLGLEADQIWGDAGGDIGAKMCKLLKEAGWHIHWQNFGAPAYDKDVYLSWSSEAWHETARKIDKCEIIIIDDPVLIAQMCCRKHKLNREGKLEMEDKPTMAKRNLPSPDRADAVCGVFAARSMRPVQQKSAVSGGWREVLAAADQERLDEYDGGGMAGMDAGW